MERLRPVVITGISTILGLSTHLLASETIELQSLKCDMRVEYESPQEEVESIADFLSEGEFYWRLRSNTFWSDKGKKHTTSGLGGSVVYQSPLLYGLGVTAGLYTTQNPIHMDDEYAPVYSAGKDVLSRHRVLTKGEYGLTFLAQAFLEYKSESVNLKVGRQIIESFLTASNDTKMIPNTFEGVLVYSTLIPSTEILAAYLTRQKLRDHSTFHHLLAYDDGSGIYDRYRENDDSAMHRGITLSSLEHRDIKDRLYILEAVSHVIKGLTLTMNYTAVPDLLSSVMLQAQTRFDWGSFKVSPAVRYMQQFDDGAGEFAGSNLKTNAFGYENPDSLDSSLIAAKVDLQKEAWMLRFGYSKIADDADIVAPWRGFPTGKFTRAMGQYNWQANTQTFMTQIGYDFEEAGLAAGMKGMIRFAKQDFDDLKPGVQADSDVYTLDLVKRFESMPGLMIKTRMAHVNGDEDTIAGDGSLKGDPSYNEVRFEINYLF